MYLEFCLGMDKEPTQDVSNTRDKEQTIMGDIVVEVCHYRLQLQTVWPPDHLPVLTSE